MRVLASIPLILLLCSFCYGNQRYFEARLTEPTSLGNGSYVYRGSAEFIASPDGIQYSIRTHYSEPQSLTIRVGEDFSFVADTFEDFYSSSTGSYFAGMGPDGLPYFYTSPAIQSYRVFQGTIDNPGLIAAFSDADALEIVVEGDENFGATATLDVTEDTIEHWLQQNGFPADSDLDLDYNGDGVPLLSVYALGLEVNQNVADRMPRAEIDGDYLYFRYHAKRQSIVYRTEASEDLVNWSRDRVLEFENSNGFRTAVIPLTDREQVYVRLVLAVKTEENQSEDGLPGFMRLPRSF